MELLASLLMLALSAIIVVLAVVRFWILAFTLNLTSALRDLRRCALTAIPLLIGLVVLVFGFSQDPLWPDQDETPARHTYWLAARKFADGVYLVSAVILFGGVICLSTAVMSSADPGIETDRG